MKKFSVLPPEFAKNWSGVQFWKNRIAKRWFCNRSFSLEDPTTVTDTTGNTDVIVMMDNSSDSNRSQQIEIAHEVINDDAAEAQDNNSFIDFSSDDDFLDPTFMPGLISSKLFKCFGESEKNSESDQSDVDVVKSSNVPETRENSLMDVTNFHSSSLTNSASKSRDKKTTLSSETEDSGSETDFSPGDDMMDSTFTPDTSKNTSIEASSNNVSIASGSNNNSAKIKNTNTEHSNDDSETDFPGGEEVPNLTLTSVTSINVSMEQSTHNTDISGNDDAMGPPFTPVTHRNISIDQHNEATIANDQTKDENKNKTINSKKEDQGVVKKATPRKRLTNHCLFCDTDVSNFARHLQRNHPMETEVAKIFSLPKLSQERKHMLEQLRKQGNFIISGTSTKPIRKSTTNRYLPCVHCCGFYSSKFLWRHLKKCDKNPNKGESARRSQTEGQNMLLKNITAHVDKNLRDVVFPRMQADRISLVAKKDYLICAFASRYLKIHRELHFINVVSRKMRELARLLIEMQNVNTDILNLLSALKPENYDLIVAATKSVAGFSEGVYKSPTYALNMGTTLKQCIDVAVLAIVKKATPATSSCEEDLSKLKSLIEGNWKFDVGNQAGNDLDTNKWNKVSMVPLAEDLKTLREYCIRKSETALNRLNTDPENFSAYFNLLNSIYVRLLLLNRRRPGELQRMPLRIFEDCQKQLETAPNSNYEEFMDSVNETEKILLKNYKRVVIRGKRGRGVPVLFSPDVFKHTQSLIKYRDRIIKTPNMYLFGNPNTDQPIIGYKTLKKFASESGTKNAGAITCTKLRKHLATLSQLFCLSENDMEQLAGFMGHTLGVHRGSYRLPDDVYQTAKISKLLMLMESGGAAKYKGKTLDDIDIDENLFEENDEDAKIDEDARIDDDAGDIIPTPGTSNESIVKVVRKPPKASKRTLVPWTEKQKSVVKTFFDEHIRKKQPPKRLDCEQLKDENPNLFDNKDWQKIKVFVQNIYSKK